MPAAHPLFTIGFTRKSAEHFFGLLEAHGVETLIDVRASNTSQLAGFTKRDDLAFFLDRILGIEYRHFDFLAPTPEIRATLKDSSQGWAEYERMFNQLLHDERIFERIDRNLLMTRRCCLLCSEPTAEHCHRRLVAEHLAAAWPEIDVRHL